MNDFQRILFPVDLSPRAALAVPFVKEIALRYHAAVSLLHVVEYPIYAYGGIPPDSQAAWEAFEENYNIGMRNLENFACEHFSDLAKTNEVGILGGRGDPGHAILAEADKIGADLIMMLTRGEGPVRGFLVGSAAVRVLHKAKCPVWTWAHADDESVPVHREMANILCALDLEHESVHVIEVATALANAFAAQVRLVHCVPVSENVPAEEFRSEFDRFLADSARVKLAKLQAEAQTDFEVCLEGGRVARVVRDVAVQRGADLIVIGRGHSHGPLSRLRSNAYAIIRDAPCPVLSL